MTTALSSKLPPGWRTARLGELLQRVERKLKVRSEIEYASVGVRWYGKGAFVRERRLGSEIAAKEQNVVKAGDVLYNKLFAWKGSFAVADESVDSLLVSGEFPTYVPDTGAVDPRFLAYYFQSAEPALQAVRLSRGVAAISRLRLNPPKFLELTIPLPQLDIQERIVAVLQRAELSVAEARRLRAESMAASSALTPSVVGDHLAKFEPTGRLGDVLTERPRNGWSAPCDNLEGGTPVLSLGAVTGFVYRPTEHKLTSEPTRPDAHYWLRPGDLLITRSNTERLVGHAAIYSGNPEPCIYPDLMMRLKLDGARADTRFVYYWLRTPGVRAAIERSGSGTSSTMKKITQQDVMSLPFPTVAPLPDQRAAVAALDEWNSRVEALQALQRSTEADLAALMPALLDRAMHGKVPAVV